MTTTTHVAAELVHVFADDVTAEAIAALPEGQIPPSCTGIARCANNMSPEAAAETAAAVRRCRAGWTDGTGIAVRALDMRAAGMTVTALAISGQE